MAKKRVEIPRSVAAKALFDADRTCCICREPKKRVQIHHIDEDPSNNHLENLAVLCLDCHGDTQITGGFGRKLDADQVTLYRDDWARVVERRRLEDFRETRDRLPDDAARLAHLTTVTEALRERGAYVMLASIYDDIGNGELRDKYVDLALAEDPTDEDVCFLRGMQNRPDLIPPELAARRLDYQEVRADWSQRARTLLALGRRPEAARDYVRSVLESLEEGRTFSAAYYLRELVEEGLVEALFETALDEATAEDDLWRQVRALQELGWYEEIDELLLQNRDRITASGHVPLLELLAEVEGEKERSTRLHLTVLTGDLDLLPPDLRAAVEREADEKANP